MHVIAVHNITDPEGFGAAASQALERIPSGMTLHSMFPSEDGRQAVDRGQPPRNQVEQNNDLRHTCELRRQAEPVFVSSRC
jgi:hypothetical protein